MERGSTKHSARLDEAMEYETRSMVASGHQSRVEESLLAEPSGEDQPNVERAPHDGLFGAPPEGMKPSDVEGRSLLASYLGKECWPATAEELFTLALNRDAPADVLSVLQDLPRARYQGIGDVWRALHHPTETHRF